jgi:pyridoxine 4-dehydrogenase
MRLTGDGIWGPPKGRKSALAVLRRAAELGVNFIDARGFLWTVCK